MGFFTLIVLAIALSLDTLAVSLTCGGTQKSIKFKQSLKIASVLAIFQGIMPVIGWLCGSSIKNYIEPIDHWVVFVLLLFTGTKMIIDCFKDEPNTSNPINSNKILITIAFATSIDALSVGIGLAMVKVNMLAAFVIITIVTFIASIIGIYSGYKIGNLLGKKMEIFGGLILIAIGTKILIEHLQM